MKFRCVDECSQCCELREYYPSKKFGKVGVLILPEEKKQIESLAKEKEIELSILPRIGISNEKSSEPSEILAYQMMGIEKNGNTCPFLDKKSERRSPHGGFTCKIYEERPLACKAYPVIETHPLELDSKCKFCKEFGSASENLDSEIESLLKIKSKMNSSASYIWRYATGIGEVEDKDEIKSGWILD